MLIPQVVLLVALRLEWVLVNLALHFDRLLAGDSLNFELLIFKSSQVVFDLSEGPHFLLGFQTFYTFKFALQTSALLFHVSGVDLLARVQVVSESGTGWTVDSASWRLICLNLGISSKPILLNVNSFNSTGHPGRVRRVSNSMVRFIIRLLQCLQRVLAYS